MGTHRSNEIMSVSNVTAYLIDLFFSNLMIGLWCAKIKAQR